MQYYHNLYLTIVALIIWLLFFLSLKITVHIRFTSYVFHILFLMERYQNKIVGVMQPCLIKLSTGCYRAYLRFSTILSAITEQHSIILVYLILDSENFVKSALVLHW